MLGTKTKKIKLLGLALLFLFLFSSLSLAQVVIINSKHWEDVYSGIYWAQMTGKGNAYFLNSPNPAGLFNLLPKVKDVILIESKSDPFVPNLKRMLEDRGYNVDYKQVDSANLELIPDQIDKFVVVEDDFPFAAIVAAPLAKQKGAWVLLVNDKNAGQVSGILSKASYVLGVGYFKRNIDNAIGKYITERIQSDSKFKLSTEVAKEFLKTRPIKTAILTEGEFIRNELLLGKNPVLLVGKNLLPNEVMEFLKNNGIKSVVLIGSHMTYVGEKIREMSNKTIAVYIEFGEATPGVSQGIYALTMFPVINIGAKLNVTGAMYDPSQKKIFLTFENQGDTGVFEFTNFRVVANGKEIASISDTEPFFVGAGETVAKGYDVEIPADQLKNVTVEVYTSYGDSADNLDKYITASGKFGPPLSLPVKVQKVSDSSQVKLEGVKYYTGYRRFAVKLKNTGDVDAWVYVKLVDVRIGGLKQSLSLDEPRLLRSGREREFYIPAQLDDLDLEDNEIVNVYVSYGEREDLLIKSINKKMELEIDRSLTTEQLAMIGGVIIVIIVIIAWFLTKRRSGGHSRGHYRHHTRKGARVRL